MEYCYKVGSVYFFFATFLGASFSAAGLTAAFSAGFFALGFSAGFSVFLSSFSAAGSSAFFALAFLTGFSSTSTSATGSMVSDSSSTGSSDQLHFNTMAFKDAVPADHFFHVAVIYPVKIQVRKYFFKKLLNGFGVFFFR